MKSLLTPDALTVQLKSESETLFNNQFINSKYTTESSINYINSVIQLRKTNKLEKYYLHSFAVWVDGCYVATLSTDCRQHGQLASLKLTFNNRIFYTAPGWLYYLRIIEKHLPLSFKSISYLELAYDFQARYALLPRMCDVYRYSNFIAANTEIMYGPADGKLKCSLLFGTQYVFGKGVKKAGTNGKQVVLYDKGEKLKKEGKQYIIDYFAANGFDLSCPIERIEVKLSGNWLKDYLLDIETLDAEFPPLFKTAVGNTFEFRKLTESYYDENRNKKTPTITLIDFSDLTNKELYRLPKSSNIIEGSSDRRNSIEVKNLVLRYVEKGNEQDLKQLHYFIATVPAPKDKKWNPLVGSYARQYEGHGTPERLARIELFG